MWALEGPSTEMASEPGPASRVQTLNSAGSPSTPRSRPGPPIGEREELADSSGLSFQPVLRIRIRMFLDLPDPDPFVRGTDPDPWFLLFFLLLYDFLSLKNGENVASKSKKQKNLEIRTHGSGSVPKCHGSATLFTAVTRASVAIPQWAGSMQVQGFWMVMVSWSSFFYERIGSASPWTK